MNEIRHVFFDLDHTIWDFESNSRAALKELFVKYKSELNEVSYERFISVYEKVNAIYWNRYRKNLVSKEELRLGRFMDAFAALDFPISHSFATDLANGYLEISPYKTNLFAGAHEVLNYLNTKYHLHIITNGFIEVQHIKLEASKLSTYFDLILCSDEIGVKKPNPIIFEFALNKVAALAHESVMIGDCIDADVRGAADVGMKAIHFDPERKTVQQEFISIQSLLDLKLIL
ncbi:noncanonical pyrimidine nucleotidase, YjjG family [Putridiphycobacter roseus]|uniref:Noncanonical pyrimidine nucleotidase, YjjG family n=1 Tax=Putridiphycobacter roseus TaxID=2219161 RepID=A0A2W1NUK5_9FLAO|nr:YjjG family noncanonical pyrimidine nucleotidase [Putridiphycobacter roseus]PZE18448.1 noncanonical pyrimidine nucleotidase, YjjG family [Putridiphycobacter roseus]